MHLHPRAVELGLERSAAYVVPREPLERIGDVGRRLGQHGQERTEQRQVEGREARLAGLAGDARHLEQVARQHPRPAQHGAGHLGGAGQGVEHEALEGALTQLAQHQPRDEALLVARRSCKQRAQERESSRAGAAPSGLGELAQRGVDVVDAQRALGGRCDLPHHAELRVADPELGLAHGPGEVERREPALACRGRPESRPDQVDLLATFARVGDLVGELGQLFQQHAPKVRARSTHSESAHVSARTCVAASSNASRPPVFHGLCPEIANR